MIDIYFHNKLFFLHFATYVIELRCQMYYVLSQTYVANVFIFAVHKSEQFGRKDAN